VVNWALILKIWQCCSLVFRPPLLRENDADDDDAAAAAAAAARG